jgi:hypothetical protein
MPPSTTTQLSSTIHNHNPNFSSTLEAVYRKLQNEQADALVPTSITQDDLTFFSACLALKSNFNAPDFRSKLTSHLGLLQSDTTILQVVGDSGTAYSPAAIKRIKALLQDLLTPRTILEYGYTATLHDANWIVNNLISTDPDLASRTIANIVFESAKAVRDWGCEATGHAKTFALVYDEGKETRFGDDVFVSDDIMVKGKGDVMICVEGGVQSFEQVVSVLARGVRVIAVTEKGVRVRQEVRFSAAGTLMRFKEVLHASEGLEARIERLIEEVKNEESERGKLDLVVRIEKALRRLVTNLESLGDITVMSID